MNSAVGPVAVLAFALVITGYLVQSRLPPPKPKIIGIDLGTTFSCVATYESSTGNITIYEDDDGKAIIPSVVAVLDNDVLVGYKAVNQIELNSKNTIFDAKRFIGRKFTQEKIARFTENYPIKVFADGSGDPRFEVALSHEVKSFSPEDIAAFILRRLKKMVENKIERTVNLAVMSVPADFNAEQRNATIRAANMAGLRVLRVINEPTAAALAYGLHKKAATSSVMVIDFGGGTLDVSLLMIQGGMFVTMAMAGNNRLGGQDVNNNLINYFHAMIQQKFGVKLHSANDLQIIRDQTEEVKIRLTNQMSAVFRVDLNTLDAINNQPIQFEYDLTREEFNLLNADIFRKFLQPIKRVLHDADLGPSDVNEIVLVGGSTRIPRIRHITAEFFGKIPNTSINPDVAVATGVAVQANIAGNGWPLKVSAVEIQNDHIKKVDVNEEI